MPLSPIASSQEKKKSCQPNPIFISPVFLLSYPQLLCAWLLSQGWIGLDKMSVYLFYLSKGNWSKNKSKRSTTMFYSTILYHLWSIDKHNNIQNVFFNVIVLLLLPSDNLFLHKTRTALPFFLLNNPSSAWDLEILFYRLPLPRSSSWFPLTGCLLPHLNFQGVFTDIYGMYLTLPQMILFVCFLPPQISKQ